MYINNNFLCTLVLSLQNISMHLPFSENEIDDIFAEIKCSCFLVINIIYTIVLIGPFIKIVLLSLMFGCPHCCRELENFFFPIFRARGCV